jgi:hypothetical protein
LFLINPLNAELNPICYLLALLEAHHILHVSRIRVKVLHKYMCITFEWRRRKFQKLNIVCVEDKIMDKREAEKMCYLMTLEIAKVIYIAVSGE